MCGLLNHVLLFVDHMIQSFVTILSPTSLRGVDPTRLGLKQDVVSLTGLESNQQGFNLSLLHVGAVLRSAM